MMMILFIILILSFWWVCVVTKSIVDIFFHLLNDFINVCIVVSWWRFCHKIEQINLFLSLRNDQNLFFSNLWRIVLVMNGILVAGVGRFCFHVRTWSEILWCWNFIFFSSLLKSLFFLICCWNVLSSCLNEFICKRYWMQKISNK